MRFRPNPRVLLAVVCLVVAVVLPPAELVSRFLSREYQSWGTQLYQGLWLLKIALGLNAVLWFSWPWAARVLDASRRPDSEAGDVRLQRSEWVVLGLLTILATILRTWGLDSGLTYDEIYFAQSMILKTPVHIFVLGTTNSSQFINWLAWLTTHAFGFSEASMRLPALAFGVATVPLTYLFARRWLGRDVATGTAVLLTVSTQAIFYSQEAKGYSATSFFALGATWAFLEARRRGLRRDWCAYGLCAFCLGFSHLFSLLVVIGHVLITLVIPDRRRMMPPLTVVLIYVGVALGLCFSISFPRSVQVLSTATEMHYATATFADRLVRNLGVPFAAGPWSYALALVALAGAARLWRINKILLGMFAIPAILGLLINKFIIHYMYMRYFNFALPSYMILASLGALAVGETLSAMLSSAGLRRGLACGATSVVPLTLLALWAWPCAQSLRGYQSRERYPFKAVARWLAALPEGSRVVAGGFGADKYRFYAPRIAHFTEVAPLCAFIERERPEYVVTYLHRVFWKQAAMSGCDPLAGYRQVYHVPGHVEEDDNPGDGFVWKRVSETSGAPAVGNLAGGHGGQGRVESLP